MGGVLGGLDPESVQLCGDSVVELFDKVVALLIELIDRSFDLGDFAVAGRGGAGFVFFVPEAIVVGELVADELQEAVVRVIDGRLVPAGDAVAVEGGDGGEGDAFQVGRFLTRRIGFLSGRF